MSDNDVTCYDYDSPMEFSQCGTKVLKEFVKVTELNCTLPYLKTHLAEVSFFERINAF